MHKQNCITAAIKKYNKRKNNHQASTNHDNQPLSSRQNINSIIEDKNNPSDDDLQYIDLTKNNSNIYSVDKPESSKKNNSKNKGAVIND